MQHFISMLTFAGMIHCSLVAAQFSPPPNVPTPAQVDDAKARAIIAEMLKAQSSKVPGKETGNLILDDVLGVIRRQGSVLDGSTLDPKPAPSVEIDAEPNASESADENSVYVVAERLLRTARMLQRLPGPDNDRAQLIHAMRSQAAKLMIDAITRETQ